MVCTAHQNCFCTQEYEPLLYAKLISRSICKIKMSLCHLRMWVGLIPGFSVLRMRQPSSPHCLVLIGTLVSGYLVSANEPGPVPANENSSDQPNTLNRTAKKQTKLKTCLSNFSIHSQNNVLQQPFKNPPRIDKSMMLKYVKI